MPSYRPPSPPGHPTGLRAIKGVLRIAGGMKRGEPDKQEIQVLMRALRDTNIPKFNSALMTSLDPTAYWHSPASALRVSAPDHPELTRATPPAPPRSQAPTSAFSSD